MTKTKKNEPVGEQWKTVDYSKLLSMDLTAAISLLSIMRDTPEVYNGILNVLEDYRKKMIALEERQDELDKLEAEKKSKPEGVNG